MKVTALQRLFLVNVCLILIMGLTRVQVAHGLEFENLGHDPVHRLFFVANGYQYKGIADAEERAKEVALRYGLAECHAYLKARGLSPADYRFKMLADPGAVRLLHYEPLDAAFQGDNLLGARVVGEVQFELTRGGENTYPAILTLSVASDKKQYQAGNHLVFRLHGNMDFFGSLLDLNPAGELIQLLPNGIRKQSSFAGNTIYLFPDRQFGDDFDLAVGPPYGQERIRFIGSNVPLPSILDSATYGSGFGVVERDMNWVDKRLREQLVDHLLSSAPQETFRCLQVYEESVDLTTFQFGYEQ